MTATTVVTFYAFSDGDLFDSFGLMISSSDPHNFIMEPVYSAFEESKLVGFLLGVTAFKT
jgi:hypothetical protein